MRSRGSPCDNSIDDRSTDGPPVHFALTHFNELRLAATLHTSAVFLLNTQSALVGECVEAGMLVRSMIGSALVTLVALSSGFATGCSAAPKDGSPEEVGATSDALSDSQKDAYINNFIASIGAPGVQTVIVKNGAVVRSKAYGNAVTNPQRAMTNDTVMTTIASASKLVTMLVAMQQVEKGTISLDDDVNKSLTADNLKIRNPAFPKVPITWRMLLTHTSSINDDEDILVDNYWFGTDPTVSFKDFMVGMFTPGGTYNRADTYTTDKPGTVRLYSNYAFSLMAYALQSGVLHEDFNTYTKREIFGKLGMTTTAWFLSDITKQQPDMKKYIVPYGCDPNDSGGFDCDTGRLFFGYGGGPPPPKGSILGEQFSFPDYADGGIRTTANQYTKVLTMFMNGGTYNGVRFLKQSTINQMATPTGFHNPYGWDQGLGLLGPSANSTEPNGGDAPPLIWGHDGNDIGVATAVFWRPDTGVGAIAFANIMNTDFTRNDDMVNLVKTMISWYN